MAVKEEQLSITQDSINEIETLKTQYKTLKQQNVSNLEQIDSYQHELQDAHNQIEQQQEANNSLMQETKDLKKQLKKLQHTINETKSETTDQYDTIEQLNDNLEKSRKTSKKYQKQAATYREQIELFDTFLVNLREENKDTISNDNSIVNSDQMISTRIIKELSQWWEQISTMQDTANDKHLNILTQNAMQFFKNLNAIVNNLQNELTNVKQAILGKLAQNTTDDNHQSNQVSKNEKTEKSENCEKPTKVEKSQENIPAGKDKIIDEDEQSSESGANSMSTDARFIAQKTSYQFEKNPEKFASKLSESQKESNKPSRQTSAIDSNADNSNTTIKQ